MEYNQIIQGDSLTVLKTLPDESVNCCVTSPPYWGLRDYGIEPVIWDGDKGCEHEWVTNIKKPNGGKGSKGANVGANKNDFANMRDHNIETDFCLKCSAWRGSLGLEPTFELYIKHLCDIFDEAKRVLRKDGTCFVNLGDSYWGGGQGGNDYGGKFVIPSTTFGHIAKGKGFQSKSLCLIPQRFAIEMVNRGWILRNTIIWHKPNCMPSSVKDRFTVDFEYVYFFVKSKKYWFEQQFEKMADITLNDKRVGNDNKGFGWKDYKKEGVNGGIEVRQRIFNNLNPQGRNKRCVWEISTKGFPEAHFAVFPETLIQTPMQAGCPRYVCKKCGKAREKIIKIVNIDLSNRPTNGEKLAKIQNIDTSTLRAEKEIKDLGYTDCGCNAGWEGGIILDPFSGAGTTAVVAKKQGKRYIGIEIKQEYIDMANKRISAIPELLPF